MKATLDYDLNDPEDERALNLALKADSYLCALREYDEWLRRQIKDNDLEHLRPAREHLHTILSENSVDIFED